jgi:hypothetical protein
VAIDGGMKGTTHHQPEEWHEVKVGHSPRHVHDQDDGMEITGSALSIVHLPLAIGGVCLSFLSFFWISFQ